MSAAAVLLWCTGGKAHRPSPHGSRQGECLHQRSRSPRLVGRDSRGGLRGGRAHRGSGAANGPQVARWTLARSGGLLIPTQATSRIWWMRPAMVRTGRSALTFRNSALQSNITPAAQSVRWRDLPGTASPGAQGARRDLAIASRDLGGKSPRLHAPLFGITRTYSAHYCEPRRRPWIVRCVRCG